MDDQCIQVVFQYWSPSKEIKHQIEVDNAYLSLARMIHGLPPGKLKKFHILNLQMLAPQRPDEYFWPKRLYEQFIIFFHESRLEGSTFKEALKVWKNDTCWYG